MKFKDIPQYTSYGTYAPHTPLMSVISWIEYETSEGLQLNPDFQRGYVWTEQQQISYMEYLLKGGKNAITIYFNMPGWMNNWEGDFVCVDGLQRITAVMKFMKNELPVFGAYYKDFEDKPHHIYLIFNVNNLKTRKEVLQWYIEFNSGGTIHTKEEINKVKKLLKEEENKSVDRNQ